MAALAPCTGEAIELAFGPSQIGRQRPGAIDVRRRHPEPVGVLSANPNVSDRARPPAGTYPIGPPPSSIPASSSAVPNAAVITSTNPICPSVSCASVSGTIASAPGISCPHAGAANTIPPVRYTDAAPITDAAMSEASSTHPAATKAAAAMGEASSAHSAAPEAATTPPAAHQFQLGRRGGGPYVMSGDRKGQRRIEVSESQCARESISSEPIDEHFEPPSLVCWEN